MTSMAFTGRICTALSGFLVSLQHVGEHLLALIAEVQERLLFEESLTYTRDQNGSGHDLK